MPARPQGASMKTQPIITTATPWQNVLMVDVDAGTATAVRSAGGVKLRQVQTIDHANLEMLNDPASLVLVNVHCEDQGGVALIEQLGKRWPQAMILAVARRRQVDICLHAFRAGASDVIFEPMTADTLRTTVDRAGMQKSSRHRLVWRNQRLRVVCRQLNKARHEIGQQVDLLCHDLVKAYQDLAEQFSQTQTSGELVNALGDDLEIERTLRKALELVLRKLGPMNAAIFLPDSENNFSLGAYLNFDTNPDSVFVSMVAQTVVSKAAMQCATISLPNDEAVREAFGSDSTLLTGRTWLATPAMRGNDCTAVIVAFQPQHKPLPQATQKLLESLAPLLAEKITRSINIYNRIKLVEDDDSQD